MGDGHLCANPLTVSTVDNDSFRCRVEYIRTIHDIVAEHLTRGSNHLESSAFKISAHLYYQWDITV